jgi:tetratricopeptide (TPR) repeat protein
MKRILLLSTLLISGLHYAQSLQVANAKTENERYREAINDFKKLVAADPINGENYFYFGDCYFEMEELDSAKIMWKKGYEVEKQRLHRSNLYRLKTESGLVKTEVKVTKEE